MQAGNRKLLAMEMLECYVVAALWVDIVKSVATHAKGVDFVSDLAGEVEEGQRLFCLVAVVFLGVDILLVVFLMVDIVIVSCKGID